MHDPNSHDDGYDGDNDAPKAVIIPYQRLSQGALDGVMEEFITREGTDYGHSEVTFEDKRRAVLAQLRSGRAYIEFDPASETCTLRARR
jgi:hypothetical protein